MVVKNEIKRTINAWRKYFAHTVGCKHRFRRWFYSSKDKQNKTKKN